MENVDLKPQDAQKITPPPAAEEFQMEMVDFGPAYSASADTSLCACFEDCYCGSGCVCGCIWDADKS